MGFNEGDKVIVIREDADIEVGTEGVVSVVCSGNKYCLVEFQFERITKVRTMLNVSLKLVSTTVISPYSTIQIIQDGIVSIYSVNSSDIKIDDRSINIKLNLNTKEFIPYLSYSNDRIKFGNIGELTDQTAIFGEKLYVGDVVELYDMRYNDNRGLKVIAKDDCCYFVMGLCGDKFVNGIYDRYQIRKVKSYSDVAHNETIEDIKYNKEEN